LAEVLKTTDRRFWAVDKLILAYLGCTTILIVGWWGRIPDAAVFFVWHVVAVAVLLYEVKRPNPSSFFFRHWYPLLYVASCYKEMAQLVPAVRHTDYDRWLADLDFRIWHVHPTVWLERIQTPAFTELLQVAYTLFVPAVLFVAFLTWRQRRFREFQYYAFLIALGYLASYAGYLLVPALGPRFLLKHLQHIPLQGLWGFAGMQSTLDRLESTAYDCFPSGHTELTILAWWGSRMVSKGIFQAYSAYTPFLIFATVYLRYHYTIDVLAGAVLAVVLILVTPAIHRKLSHGG
jgi:membrane-associated phospholipid phosphatase